MGTTGSRRTITVNGVGLYYEVRGEGEPLVLVHGEWTDLDSWHLVAPRLAESFHVVSYDRRGHSRSERPARQGSRRADENDLIALVEELDVGPAHLVGNSHGGSIALTVAARRPDLVRTVAAHEPPLLEVLEGSPEGAAIARRLLATMETIAAESRSGDIERGTARFMEEVVLGPGSWALLPDQRRQVFLANAPMFVDLLGDPAWPAMSRTTLESIAAPALVSHGDRSAAWFAAIVDELAASIPGVRRHAFEGAGHAPHLTHVDDYAATIEAFATTAAPASAAAPAMAITAGL